MNTEVADFGGWGDVCFLQPGKASKASIPRQKQITSHVLAKCLPCIPAKQVQEHV